LVFSSAVSVGAAFTLDLQAATAWATAGLAAAAPDGADAPPALLAVFVAAALVAAVVAAAGADVVAAAGAAEVVAAGAAAGVVAEVLLLLLLPQPVMATAPTLATTHNNPSLLITMCLLGVVSSIDPLIG
jgi:hypothetical protein